LHLHTRLLTLYRCGSRTHFAGLLRTLFAILRWLRTFTDYYVLDWFNALLRYLYVYYIYLFPVTTRLRLRYVVNHIYAYARFVPRSFHCRVTLHVITVLCSHYTVGLHALVCLHLCRCSRCLLRTAPFPFWLRFICCAYVCYLLRGLPRYGLLFPIFWLRLRCCHGSYAVAVHLPHLLLLRFPTLAPNCALRLRRRTRIRFTARLLLHARALPHFGCCVCSSGLFYVGCTRTTVRCVFLLRTPRYAHHSTAFLFSAVHTAHALLPTFCGCVLRAFASAHYVAFYRVAVQLLFCHSVIYARSVVTARLTRLLLQFVLWFSVYGFIPFARFTLSPVPHLRTAVGSSFRWQFHTRLPVGLSPAHVRLLVPLHAVDVVDYGYYVASWLRSQRLLRLRVPFYALRTTLYGCWFTRLQHLFPVARSRLRGYFTVFAWLLVLSAVTLHPQLDIWLPVHVWVVFYTPRTHTTGWLHVRLRLVYRVCFAFVLAVTVAYRTLPVGLHTHTAVVVTVVPSRGFTVAPALRLRTRRCSSFCSFAHAVVYVWFGHPRGAVALFVAVVLHAPSLIFGLHTWLFTVAPFPFFTYRYTAIPFYCWLPLLDFAHCRVRVGFAYTPRLRCGCYGWFHFGCVVPPRLRYVSHFAVTHTQHVYCTRGLPFTVVTLLPTILLRCCSALGWVTVSYPLLVYVYARFTCLRHGLVPIIAVDYFDSRPFLGSAVVRTHGYLRTLITTFVTHHGSLRYRAYGFVVRIDTAPFPHRTRYVPFTFCVLLLLMRFRYIIPYLLPFTVCGLLRTALHIYALRTLHPTEHVRN